MVTVNGDFPLDLNDILAMKIAPEKQLICGKRDVKVSLFKESGTTHSVFHGQ